MGAGVAQRPPGEPALCSVQGPPTYLKVVQESGAAQMLLLITETSQSNSLLVCVCVGGSGGRVQLSWKGGQNCPSGLGTTLGWRGLSSEPEGQRLNPLRWFPAHPVPALSAGWGHVCSQA